MRNFIELIKHESNIYFFKQKFPILLTLYLLLILFIIPIIKPNISVDLIILFLYLSLPLAITAFAPFTILQNYLSGKLEILFSCFNHGYILFAHLTNVILAGLLSWMCVICFLSFAFNVNNIEIILINGVFLTITSAMLSLNACLVNCFFNKNNSLVNLFMFPLLLPSITLASLSLHSPENSASLIFINFGTNVICAILYYYTAKYLLMNIYNNR